MAQLRRWNIWDSRWTYPLFLLTTSTDIHQNPITKRIERANTAAKRRFAIRTGGIAWQGELNLVPCGWSDDGLTCKVDKAESSRKYKKPTITTTTTLATPMMRPRGSNALRASSLPAGDAGVRKGFQQMFIPLSPLRKACENRFGRTCMPVPGS